MATSSLLGGNHMNTPPGGKDTDALGPSDNSDSGSDAQGAYGDDELASDSDAVGTGERATIGAGRDRADADILPDHVEQLPGDGDDDASPDGEADPVDENINVDELAADDEEESEDPDVDSLA
ncbi:MAG: hypothetical protein EOO28_27240 [Comamonadaceae bacterium]|nr:MAG: hypothetical protein EOO28_27240 [Comamonadaceae bacterium]